MPLFGCFNILQLVFETFLIAADTSRNYRLINSYIVWVSSMDLVAYLPSSQAIALDEDKQSYSCSRHFPPGERALNIH